MPYPQPSKPEDPVIILQLVCGVSHLPVPEFTPSEKIEGEFASFYEVQVIVGSLTTTGSGITFYSACQSGAMAMTQKIRALQLERRYKNKPTSRSLKN